MGRTWRIVVVVVAACGLGWIYLIALADAVDLPTPK